MRRAWAYFKKREALLLWHEHLDEQLLGGGLLDHIHRRDTAAPLTPYRPPVEIPDAPR